MALTTAPARPVEGLCPRCWLPRLWHIPVVALFDSGPLEAGHFLVCEDCGQLPVDDTEETDR